MALPVTRPWHAALVILAEQVARGVKPLASLSVFDSDPGEVDLYLREWNKDRPGYVRKLMWQIEPMAGTDASTVYMFYDELLWQVYTEGQQLPVGAARHALMGFLFGYDFDDIIHYIKFSRGSEETR